MADAEPTPRPDVTIESVDWLPSGGRSGLVRVRGRRAAATAGADLPELVIVLGGEEHRHVSLPDPRAARDPLRWRGAYVVQAGHLAPQARLELEWTSGARVAIPSPDETPVVPEGAAAPAPDPPGGEVVDRAVLAERRARRAEAAEQAQARIAKEALRAVEVLELRTSELEEKLAAADRLRALPPAPAPAPAVPAAAAPDPEADRRVARLRSALSASIVTTAELRLQLHALRAARRTADLTRGADAVRLAALAAERAGARAELERLRAEAAQLRDALAQAQAAQAEAAERIAVVETRALTAVADAEERAAAAASERDEARARAEALDAELAELRAAGEQAQAAAGERRRLEAALAAAETAREVAEATAAAATRDRQAAEVAWAAAADELAELRAASQIVHPMGGQTATESDPAALAEIARRLAATPAAATGSGRVVADLEAAAEALRRNAPAPVAEPEADARPRVVSPVSAPPSRVAQGRDARAYPPLRGALVKLAHDDPPAAGRLLAGLLPAQWRLLAEPVDWDLTLEGVGTFASTVRSGGARVEPIERPRGDAEFHLRADPVSLAEMLAGVPHRPRRFTGRVRSSGRRRRVAALQPLATGSLTLSEAVRAGADLDPVLVLRALAYAVHPSWTEGHDFTVTHVVSGEDGAEHAVHLTARSGRGLSATTGPPPEPPAATVRLTRAGFGRLLAGEPVSGPDRPASRGDHRAVETLRGWADRARGVA